ncbi:MAG: class I SAM-dependent methyltransferase [Pseudomonadota bacterium]
MSVYARTREHVLGMLPKSAVGAEIGVWKGDFSAQILKIAAPAVLHLIDPWAATDAPDHQSAWYATGSGVDMEAIHDQVLARFEAERRTGQIVIHRASSEAALSALPDASLDFVYVDGDHAYDAVRRDLLLAVAKTKPGGLICVDDHRTDKWWGDGVVRAVNEVLGAHPSDLILRFAANTQVVITRR